MGSVLDLLVVYSEISWCLSRHFFLFFRLGFQSPGSSWSIVLHMRAGTRWCSRFSTYVYVLVILVFHRYLHGFALIFHLFVVHGSYYVQFFQDCFVTSYFSLITFSNRNCAVRGARVLDANTRILKPCFGTRTFRTFQHVSVETPVGLWILFLDKNAWALDSGHGARALNTSAMALA